MRSMVEGHKRVLVTWQGRGHSRVPLHHLLGFRWRFAPSASPPVRGGILASESAAPHHHILSLQRIPRLHIVCRTRFVLQNSTKT